MPDQTTPVKRHASRLTSVCWFAMGVVHEAGPASTVPCSCCHATLAQEKTTPTARSQNKAECHRIVGGRSAGGGTRKLARDAVVRGNGCGARYLCGTAGTLLLVALMACVIPAHRALILPWHYPTTKTKESFGPLRTGRLTMKHIRGLRRLAPPDTFYTQTRWDGRAWVPIAAQSFPRCFFAGH